MTDIDNRVPGPVDYLLVEWTGGGPDGEVAPHLIDLVDRGLIRILDLRFLAKDADGSVTEIEIADVAAAGPDPRHRPPRRPRRGRGRRLGRKEGRKEGRSHRARTPEGHRAAGGSTIDQLKELASLKAEGVLTEEEFAAQKAKLLGT